MMMQSDYCKTVVVGFECANVPQIASQQQRKATAQRPSSLLSKAFASQQPSQWLELHYSDDYETDDEFFESDAEHHSMQTLSSESSSACSPFTSSVSLASSEPIDIPYKRSPFWATTGAVAPAKPYAVYTAAQLQGQRFQGAYSTCAQQAQLPHKQGHHSQH